MALIPISLPPGMYRNGTPYTRRGRWTDGSLVRWHDGSVRPIGGWLRRRDVFGDEIASPIVDPTDECIRDVFAWRDNEQDQQVVLGSNRGLYHLSQDGVITEITPGGYTGSIKDAAEQAGYGQNPYGVGAYGAPNNLVGIKPIPMDRWYFDNFGEILLTGVRNSGDLYELDIGTLTLSPVLNAPVDLQDIVVTEQRQVFTIGGAGEPRRIRISEIEDRTLWTPAIDNAVIDQTLPGTGRFLRCVQVLRQVLILGENDAYTARFIGPPYVYSFDLAGENCGPLSAEGVIRTDRFAVWWGDRNFWLYDGSVQVLNCDVIDYLYNDLDIGQAAKITAVTNSDYTEIWWYYQSASSTTGETDSYVMWNYRDNTWATGRLDRTGGVDKGVLLTTLLVDPDGNIFNHELQDVLPTGDVFAETGALELRNGEQNMAVRYIYPDNENAGDVTYELIGRQFPNSPEFTFGPYPYNNPIPTRAFGRDIKLKVNFQTATAEHGDVRFDVAPVGTGRR